MLLQVFFVLVASFAISPISPKMQQRYVCMYMRVIHTRGGGVVEWPFFICTLEYTYYICIRMITVYVLYLHGMEVDYKNY